MCSTKNGHIIYMAINHLHNLYRNKAQRLTDETVNLGSDDQMCIKFRSKPVAFTVKRLSATNGVYFIALKSMQY